MAKILKKPAVLFIFWLLLITIIISWPFITKGQVPIAGDILYGHYHPWVDVYKTSETTTYPIKNLLIFDGIRQTLPWRLLAISELKSGQWPLWNPYNLLGTPLLANIQTAALYPLNILFWLTSELNAWSIYILVQPALAALGMWFFLRSEKINPWSAAIASVGVSLSGLMSNHLTFGIDGHTFLWLPWSMFAVNKVFKKSIHYVPILSLFVSMSFFGGYLPPAIYSFMVLIAWIGFKLYKTKQLRESFLAILSITLGFCIAAAQLLPTLEISNMTMRADKWFGQGSGEPFYWPFKHLLMILAPKFFGHPSTGNFYSEIEYTDNPYIGGIGLFGLIFSFFSKNTNKTFPITISAISLLYALPTPISSFIRSSNLPFLSDVASMRVLWITTFSFAWMAAIGLNEVIKRKISMLKLASGVLTVAIIYCIAWFLTGIIPPYDYYLVAIKNLIIPTTIIIIGILASYIHFKIKTLPLWVLGLVFLILTSSELVRETIKYTPFIEKEMVAPKTKTTSFLKDQGLEYRTLITEPDLLLPPNSNIFYQIPMIDGYQSLRSKHTEQFIALNYADDSIDFLDSFPRVIYAQDHTKDVIDLMSAKYVISLRGFYEPNLLLKLKLLFSEGDTHVYENTRALPKAWFVDGWQHTGGDLDSAQKIIRSQNKSIAYLHEPIDLPISLNTQDTNVIVDKIYPGNITIKTFNRNPSLLLLSESYDKGWNAYIDNEKTSVIRTDINLQAIKTPPGKHLINFVYEPESFTIGLRLSVLSLLATLLVYLKLKIIK